MPTPALMRDKWVHIRFSRGNAYCELRQLHRQACFVRPRTRRENIENHFGAIEHLDAQGLLQVAGLGRRKIVVEDHRVGIGGADHQLQLLDFAFAEIRRLIRRGTLLSEAADDFRPGGFYKSGQFVQVIAGRMAIGQLNADQYGRLALYALLTVCVLHYGSRLLSDCLRGTRQGCLAPRVSCSIIPRCQEARTSEYDRHAARTGSRAISMRASRVVRDRRTGRGPPGSPTFSNGNPWSIVGLPEYSRPTCPPW